MKRKIMSVLLCAALLLTFSVSVSSQDSTNNIASNSNNEIVSKNSVEPRVQTGTIVDNGVYRIKNVSSGKYLNVHYGVDADHTNIYQWTGDGSTEQKWRVSYNLATDAYHIYSMCSSGGKNRCLDVTDTGGNLVNGANIKLYTPTEPPSQEIDIVPLGNNQYKIVMKRNSNMCLTAYGTSNGTSGGTTSTSAGNVFISTYTGAANQKWTFEYTNTKVVVAPTGWLDSVSSTAISGWMWRSDLPNSPTKVYFNLVNNDTGDQYNFSTIANTYRSDLLNAGCGNGYHGFSYTIDWRDYLPGNYTINVFGAEGAVYYLSGSPKTYVNELQHTYSNLLEEGVQYLYPLDGGVITGVGFIINCNAFVKTSTITNRIVTEVSTFAKTEPNPNPEISSPDITVGTTTLNGTEITMTHDPNVWFLLEWVWDNKVGYPNIVAVNNSTYNTTVSVMLVGAIYPLQTVVNSFSF